MVMMGDDDVGDGDLMMMPMMLLLLQMVRTSIDAHGDDSAADDHRSPSPSLTPS